MPVRQRWVRSLTQRFQQAVWRGVMLMPDELVSQVVMARGRLLSVEAQDVSEGFARRLRLVERDPGTGAVVRERSLGFDVPDGQERCRLLQIAGRWYVAHRPWADAPVPQGILMPWPDSTGTGAPHDVIRADLLPGGMARRLDDGECFNSDGQHLLVATVLPGQPGSDTRRWLLAACVDVARAKLLWGARTEIRFPIERYRHGARVGRFGDVVVARAATVRPPGGKRCCEVFAAFRADNGLALWSRAAPRRGQPPAFDLVADDERLYVNVDDSGVEAWRLDTGRTVWRKDVRRTIVADAVLHQGELNTFVGEGYPVPGSPRSVHPIAIETGQRGRVHKLGGEVEVVLSPSFVVLPRWILSAPDGRLLAWSIVHGDAPLAWRCWRLPGGLSARDTAGRMFQIDARTILTYTPGTCTLTSFRVEAAR